MRTRHLAAVLLLGSSMLAACTPAPSLSGGFSNVTSSSGTVSSTEDGCTQSFLMSAFQVERAASPAGAPSDALSHTWTASLTAPAHVAGAQVSMDVRGAVLGGNGAGGQLQVSFAGAQQTFDLAEAGNFTQTFAAPAVEGANALDLTATLPAGSTDAAIHVDSVDLIVDGAFCSGSD